MKKVGMGSPPLPASHRQLRFFLDIQQAIIYTLLERLVFRSGTV